MNIKIGNLIVGPNRIEYLKAYKGAKGLEELIEKLKGMNIPIYLQDILEIKRRKALEKRKEEEYIKNKRCTDRIEGIFTL